MQVTSALSPLLLDILTDAQARLEAIDNPAGRVTITAGGSTPWDSCNCSEGGQLYLRINQIHTTGAPGVTFPNANSAATNIACSPWVAVQVSIGVLRCAHVISSSGSIPTPDEETGDALETLGDMSAVLETIATLEENVYGVQRVLVVDWRPLGPEGGCVGGEWTAWLAFDTSCARSFVQLPDEDDTTGENTPSPEE